MNTSTGLWSSDDCAYYASGTHTGLNAKGQGRACRRIHVLADATLTFTPVNGTAQGPMSVAAGTVLDVQASSVTCTAAHLIMW